MISDLKGFCEAIIKNTIAPEPENSKFISHKILSNQSDSDTDDYIYPHDDFIDDMFCDKCHATRKTRIKNCIKETEGIQSKEVAENPNERLDWLPIVYKGECQQCYSVSTIVIYSGIKGAELAILKDTPIGHSTPNTPVEIAYYLNEASISRAGGAKSASATMYRSALEWLLYLENYKQATLDAKIKKLLDDISKGNAPLWVRDVDDDYFDCIRKIGNGATHTNKGDIAKQANIDEELLSIIDEVFEELLDAIYELPNKKNARKAKLKSRSSSFK